MCTTIGSCILGFASQCVLQLVVVSWALLVNVYYTC